MRCISCTSRRSPDSTWSITSRTASPRSATSRRRACRAASARGEDGASPGAIRCSEYASNLNELALEGKIDPLIGRAGRNRAHHPGAVPSPQEQPAVCRRGRRGQDRAGRGPGQAHRRRRRARSAGKRHHLVAGSGRPGRRHQVPRRFREAPEGGDRASSRSSRARSCSSTRSTPSSAPVPPRAAPWMPAT